MTTLPDGSEMPNCSYQGKRIFASEQEALTFELNNRRKYNVTRQYVYPCDHCTGWHLTTKTPGAPTLAQANLGAIAMPNNEIKHHAPRGSVTPERVAQLDAQGKTAKEIAAALGCTTSTVYSRRKEIKDSSVVLPVTLDSIAAEEKRLQEQLDRLSKQKHSILEAKRLKLNPCTFKNVPGVFVSQDGQSMSFRLEDFAELVMKGGEYLGSRQESIQ